MSTPARRPTSRNGISKGGLLGLAIAQTLCFVGVVVASSVGVAKTGVPIGLSNILLLLLAAGFVVFAWHNHDSFSVDG